MVLEQESAHALAAENKAFATSAPADSKAQSIVQSLILILLFAVPAIFFARTNGIHDPDIWWHLRTGQWMLQHHAIPHTDSFSAFAAGKPWQAYSWLFEVLVYKLFSAFGLRGILLYVALMSVLITAALHHMVKRLQRDFSIIVLLTAAGTICLGHLYTPRPWLFTILFFVLECDILMQARRSGRLRGLFWLPVIFALWANLHIQFIDGLLVLGFASAESIFAVVQPSLFKAERPRLHWLATPATTIVCILATCLNPYGPSIYRIAYELNAQTGVLDLINELKAVAFRDVIDFVMLLLTLAACAVLARARNLPLFETVLFAFAVFVSFRSERDVWVIGTVAVAILASRLAGSEKAKDYTTAAVAPLAALAAMLAVIVAGLATHVDNSTLRKQMSLAEPVQAVDFIHQQGFVGPLYNDFNWGGYLIFNLQDLPASIDGRTVLMGQKHIDRALGTVGAQPGWSADPQLAAARVVLLPISAPLASVLQMDSRFRLVYQDKLAVVFVAHQPTVLKPSFIDPNAVPVVQKPHCQEHLRRISSINNLAKRKSLAE